MLKKERNKLKSKVRTVSKAKKEAWKAFSLFIRLRDCLNTTKTDYEGKCITCNRTYPGFTVGGLQAGHFIPGRKNDILFNEKQVNAQCYHCNVGLKGNWPEYYKVMVKKYGQKEVEKMINKKYKTIQFKVFRLDEIRDKYKDKHKELKGMRE